MAQKKLFRFGEIKKFKNVLEYPNDIKNKWSELFGNKNPIVLELACGRGEYTIGLSKLFPEKNFIGVDVKGNRMYLGAKTALDQNLKNAAFLRTQIEMIDNYFGESEVDEIWITFPDPQLRLSKAKKRLTHPRFLRLYHKFLKPNGKINLKTDSPDLYNFTLDVINIYGFTIIENRDNLYSDLNINDSLKIKTHYEKMDIARSERTHFLSFSLPHDIPEKDSELKTLLNEKAF